MIIRPFLYLCSLFAPQQQEDFLHWLPSETLVAAYAPDLGQTLEKLLESGAYHKFYSGPLFKELSARPEYVMGMTGVQGLLNSVDREPTELISALCGNGTVFGFWPSVEDGELHAVLAFASKDATVVQEALNHALAFASKGEVQVEGDHWQADLDEVHLERRDKVFLVGTSPAALKRFQKSDSSVSTTEEFQRAVQHMEKKDAWAWMDGDLIRYEDNLPRKPEDVGASFIGAELHEALLHTPWIMGDLSITSASITFNTKLPTPSHLKETHAPFFPEPREVNIPQLTDSLGYMIFHRDMASWWNSRDLYMNENAVAESVETDGNFSLLFGRDFGPEVLHWLEPEMLFLSARRPYEGRLEIEIPGFAFGMKIREGAPEDLENGFINAFMAAILFTNFDGTKEPDEVLLLDMQSHGDGSHTYLGKYREWNQDVPAPVEMNFAPAMWIHPNGEVWMASAVEILDEIRRAPRSQVQANGDFVEIAVKPGLKILDADKDALIAQRVLEEGGDMEEAEAFFIRLRSALDLYEAASIRRYFQDGYLLGEAKIFTSSRDGTEEKDEQVF